MDAQKMSHKRIEALAYRLWEERGSPPGSPDEDWLAAERTVLAQESLSALLDGSATFGDH